MGIKMMHHVCIQTENYRESIEFYTKVLGFKVVQETKNFHNREFNTWLKLGIFMIELQTNKKEDKLNNWSELNAGIVHMCFLVDNVQEEFKRIKELGYTKFKLKNGEAIYKVENHYLCKIKAPEGTEIEMRDVEGDIMEYRETIIKEYFNSWINQNDSVLETVFAVNAKYIECYGPAYDGLVQIQKWFMDWHKHGRVLSWTINKFVHNGEDSVCDWYFECEYDGKIDGFNGVSWIKFNEENKITEFREYQSKVPNYFPYNNN